MVFAMILQVFAVGDTVGWWGLDGGYVGFWVYSRQ